METIRIKVENNLNDIIYYLWAMGYVKLNGLQLDVETFKGAEYLGICGCNVYVITCECPRYISLQEFKRRYPITLHHLKPGMVVEYRDGRQRFVMQSFNRLYLANKDGYQLLFNYRPDLTEDSNQRSLDIMKVYIIADSGCINLVQGIKPNGLDQNLKLVWDREAEHVVELTIEDIAKKLGIDPQLIRIKSEKD